MRPAVRQQREEAPQPPEEGTLPHAVYLQASTPLDATLQVGGRRRALLLLPRGHPPPLPPPLPTPALSRRLQGTGVKSTALLAWHPTKQRLVAATTAAVVEYDAVSGTRRNLAEVTGTPLRLAYTPSGGAVVLLTKERSLYAWGSSTWRRRVLLPPDPKYAGKKLAAALLAVSPVSGPAMRRRALCNIATLAGASDCRQADALIAPALPVPVRPHAGAAAHRVLDAAGQEHGAHGAHRAARPAQG